MVRRSLLIAIVVVLVGAVGLLGYWLGTNQSVEEIEPPDDIEIPVVDALASAVMTESVRIEAGADIQPVVDANPPGTVYLLSTGEYRGQSIIPKDGDVFVGEPGVVLNGSLLLEDFEVDGDVWFVGDQVQDPWFGGPCREATPNCNSAYDLYFNDQPLLLVASRDEVTAGTWFFDFEADRVYLGDNPEGHKIEVSASFYAFDGEASDVTLQNLTVEKYAGPGQQPAIRALDSTDWIIRNVTVQLNSGGGIGFGEGTQIINSRVIRNGQIGISGIGNDVLVEGTEIAYNNYAGYEAGWEAGGTKFFRTENLIVRDNYVHNNDGPGLWTDTSNFNTLYENNVVIANQGPGILHEISYDAVIRGNVVKFNNPYANLLFNGAQILISSSGGVLVEDNEVVVSPNGGNGIAIIQQERGGDERGTYLSTRIRIENNTIVYMGVAGESGAAGEDNLWEDESIVFNNNVYYLSDLSVPHWGWANAARTWEGFREFGFETDGQVVLEIPLSALSVPAWAGSS